MNLKINTKRSFTIDHEFKTSTGESIPVKFYFTVLAGEDTDFNKLREKMSIGKVEGLDNIDKKTAGSYNAFLYTLRTSLVACEGIENEKNEPIIIIGKDGIVDKTLQIIVFEVIQSDADLLTKVITAYGGVKEKNL